MYCLGVHLESEEYVLGKMVKHPAYDEVGAKVRFKTEEAAWRIANISGENRRACAEVDKSNAERLVVLRILIRSLIPQYLKANYANIEGNWVPMICDIPEPARPRYAELLSEIQKLDPVPMPEVTVGVLNAVRDAQEKILLVLEVHGGDCNKISLINSSLAMEAGGTLINPLLLEVLDERGEWVDAATWSE
jgi:hypothetical protein